MAVLKPLARQSIRPAILQMHLYPGAVASQQDRPSRARRQERNHLAHHPRQATTPRFPADHFRPKQPGLPSQAGQQQSILIDSQSETICRRPNEQQE